jgi:Leucine-rich repeat (LRR) protein
MLFEEHQIMIMRICLAISALAVLQSTVAVGEDLFPDKNLESVVRREVFAKRDNQEPLTEDDVKNISRVIGRGKAIKSLKGLEKCRSLAEIRLADNEISDLSPIAGLTVLQSIDFAGNKIADLTPLAGLTGLQYLELSNNEVVELKPLAKLENMRSLYLSHNKIKKLEPISGLSKMWSLYLDGNPLDGLAPLAKLVKLKSLDLRETGVSDLSPLAAYTELDSLLLEGNKVSDLSVLVEMAKKDFEGPKRFAPFIRLYLARNPLSEDAKEGQLKSLAEFGCRIMPEIGK